MYTNIYFVLRHTSHLGRSVSISYLFWLASGMQIQLLTHSLWRDKHRQNKMYCLHDGACLSHKNTAIMHDLVFYSLFSVLSFHPDIFLVCLLSFPHVSFLTGLSLTLLQHRGFPSKTQPESSPLCRCHLYAT